ncbi:sulfatase-like hydrolase/transferase [Flavivirga amylovorans]|uniref:Sulfatase-like hydrolase/transferase n=1 Tax=Flavivirga amylovorans TaxID=870486 RepID=A0ABT8WWY1_9FLAO|nr:sulfatase-like hydrolase/transferase [Flavivirga amylovorans]MDO5986207.1 sulfatase-like hydrolase/transferase [Flavivirga amylovorans]
MNFFLKRLVSYTFLSLFIIGCSSTSKSVTDSNKEHDTQNQSKQPNIILMMADDLGWGDVGFNGNNIIKTPNLDQMAKEGVKLTHFYSIGPVCSPTRASFLTGRHYFRMGIWSANKGHLPKEENTIASVLKKEGYATGHFGKWHLGTLSKTISAKGSKRKPEINYAPPAWFGYDESFVTESAVSTWNPAEGRRSKNNPYYLNGVPETENLKGDDSRVMMDRVIPFIQKSAKANQPFVAVIWFHAPHQDIIAGPEYLKMYEGHGQAAHYYGCITALDDQVGRLRKELKNLGIDQNTALFFTSDNGPEGKTPKDRKKVRTAGSAGEFSGRKRSVLDGGVRVPGLALWPGHIKPNTVIDVPMSVLDYLPTVCEMTSAKLPEGRVQDGENILPVLKGEKNVHDKPIPFRHENYACLVEGKYKLIIESEKDIQKDRLFDLSKDIKEMNNIASQYPEKVRDMRAQIIEFLASAKSTHKGGEYNITNYKPVDNWVELGSFKPKKKNKKKLK